MRGTRFARLFVQRINAGDTDALDNPSEVAYWDVVDTFDVDFSDDCIQITFDAEKYLLSDETRTRFTVQLFHCELSVRVDQGGDFVVNSFTEKAQGVATAVHELPPYAVAKITKID